MFPAREHHLKGSVCLTRPPYRNGKKLRGVKVYTIAQESKYLLIQNLSSIGGALEQLLPHLNEHGPVEQHWRLDGYQSKDEEEFVDTLLVQYRQVEHARRSKHFLDDWNFLGTHLHICYAPECETVDELREKMQERRTIVQRKAEMNSKSLRKPFSRASGKTRSSTVPIRSQASQRTTEDIRARMRDAVQKSNLISLVLEQEVKKKKRLQI